MNIIIKSRIVKIIIILTIYSGSYSYGQNNNHFLKYFKKLNCTYSNYDGLLLSNLLQSELDTIPINLFDSIVGQQKAYYFKNGVKKQVFGIGKIGILPATEVEDWSTNPPTKKYIKRNIIPICYKEEQSYTNFIYIYCSFDIVNINLLVVNKNWEIISYLKLCEGNYDFIKNKLSYLVKSTKISNNTYIQEIVSESPENNLFTKKFIQRSTDGYFELIE